MTSPTHRHFWTYFDRLPGEIQARAREKYRLWQRDPFHPPLQFKLLVNHVWSVRIGPFHRALARRSHGLVVWFWIGTHEEYNNLVQRLRL